MCLHIPPCGEGSGSGSLPSSAAGHVCNLRVLHPSLKISGSSPRGAHVGPFVAAGQSPGAVGVCAAVGAYGPANKPTLWCRDQSVPRQEPKQGRMNAEQ